MIPYAPLVVALFRLFRQAAWRNIRSVSMLISSVRRAFQLLWRRKGDLSRRGGASAPNTNAEGDSCSWQPTIFAASQDLSPGVGALLQDSTTSNDIEHLDAASVVSPHHSSLNATPGDAPTFDKGSGADSASPNNAEPFHVSVSPGSHSLEPAPEGPSISDKDNGTSTYHPTSASEPRALALSVEIPGFRPIVPTDIRRRADRHGRASPQGKHDITIPPGVDRTWMMGTAAPVGWGKFAHPEGTTYFRSLQQTAGAWVFTYANLGLPEMLETITHFLQSFKEFLETYSLHLREGSELVLDLEEGSGNLKDYCGYYVKVKGTVYWFDEFKAMDLEIWKTVLGVTPTHAHIGAKAGEDSHAGNDVESRNAYVSQVSRLIVS
ncbi:hypothetical protein EYR40_004611 [Pleurotus pulmonarius]|nr:hypothetical protein EYR38_001842 [Pleurotus pulmonarius]KAF4605821.1 hypothetical protein EYR40_004611 [Pleurotus pulmonarius]